MNLNDQFLCICEGRIPLEKEESQTRSFRVRHELNRCQPYVYSMLMLGVVLISEQSKVNAGDGIMSRSKSSSNTCFRLSYITDLHS